MKLKGSLGFISLITGILILFGMMFGAYQHFDGKFAHAGDVYRDMSKAMEVISKMGTRLDLHIIEGELRIAQQKIDRIEDQYCPDKSKPCTEDKMPQIIRDQYRELKLERENLQEELKALKSERAKAKAQTK